ncbi:Serine/threonine protein kinase [Nannocystis exedens]|uniref:Serine/threonine protein kinase n=1 Tax=Nannocystis exedens TaxID=54 RepID=A0A1I2AWC7_9BACT|nr:protein kinase [Nannocystis exedens]PCC74269.1 Serine/threonine-protein kinase PknB [Nannocystis exedens]SFE47323.1 Serine/threonine protein kinase [Nannocystis exedens]
MDPAGPDAEREQPGDLASSPGLPQRPEEDDALEARRMLAAVRRGLFGKSVPEVHVGRFALRRQLGCGGMGVVYEAWDPELGRAVAVKVLRPRSDAARSPEHRARLELEARAMARLQHPNVLTVYEVGEADGRTFVAMELATGGTLRAWLATPRSWRAVVERFVEAGRGLAAAHTAGLVHRDFKPENVFMHGHTARVGDFGLARQDGSDEPTDPEPLQAGVDPRWTRTGTTLGTPAYMAPEQWERATVDARADQFSFCVALYEALYGARPVVAGVPDLGVVAGATAVVPAPPRWLRAALERGLQRRPEQRWPTMHALVAELERGLQRGRRRAWLAAGLTSLALAVGVVLTGRGRIDCAGEGARVEAHWNAARAAALQAGLAATGVPYAEASGRAVAAILDARAGAWRAARVEACQAWADGARSDSLYARQVACLERRLGEFGATIELLVDADEQVAAGAVEAAAGLRGLERCQDAEALLAGDATVTIDSLADVQALAGLDRARAWLRLGVPARARAGALAALSRTPARMPASAEAHTLVGRAAADLGELAEAELALAEGFRRAYATGADEVAAEAATAMLGVVGGRPGADALVLRWARHARVAVRRAGLGAAEEVAVDDATAKASLSRGDLDAAEAALRAGLGRASAGGLADDLRLAPLHALSGELHRRAGRSSQARAAWQRALDLLAPQLGETHPRVLALRERIASLAR